MKSRDRKSLEKSNQRLQNPWNFFIYCDLNHYCGMIIVTKYPLNCQIHDLEGRDEGHKCQDGSDLTLVFK